MRTFTVIVVFALSISLDAQQWQTPPRSLPSTAVRSLAASLTAAMTHRPHIWRDTSVFNADGTVNAYVEIAMGDRRKWEYDMATNRRAIDRMIPETVGGYPINYGYVPQTVSYDGDPFDALITGPPIEGGTLVRGVIVGVMFMEDEKGLDSKVVLSRVDAQGRRLHELTAADQRRIGDYFRRYKQHQPGAFSRVPGWGTVAQGRAYVDTTHRFYEACRATPPPVQSAATVRCAD
jgi:inorganic pyrophosphatase